MKSEPDVFSIEDLKKKKSEHWDGVRNYQARNYMRDEMKRGDKVLFYHSNCKPPGIAGIAKVVKESYPDHTAWDKKSPYYDAKSNAENPRWFMVDIAFVKKFKNYLSLHELKNIQKLSEFKLLQKGNRLSVFPIEKAEFEYLQELGEKV